MIRYFSNYRVFSTHIFTDFSDVIKPLSQKPLVLDGKKERESEVKKLLRRMSWRHTAQFPVNLFTYLFTGRRSLPIFIAQLLFPFCYTCWFSVSGYNVHVIGKYELDDEN